ncbi:MAG: tetratricopeptide repeat protein, partial [Treponema sp.]|nr:tetratricopeptide repeat protein [Treponema sp.]
MADLPPEPAAEEVQTSPADAADSDEPEPEIEPELEPEPEIEIRREPELEAEPPEAEDVVIEAVPYDSPLPEERAEALLPPGVFRDAEEDLLPEPFIDLAESLVEPTPPQEEPLSSALPEPLAPYLPEPPAEIPVVAEPPVPTQPEAAPPITVAPVPEPAPTPEPVAEPVTPVVPPVATPLVPETAPPFIRPAEEETPPVTREPVPRQVLPESPAYTPPDIGEQEMNFSRVVRATVGQLVEVPFRGNGWVYLGELGSRPGIVYNSRRLDSEGQSFVFRVEAAGIYALKFYKQDFIRDYILNDYVQVVASDPPEATATGWFNPAIDRGRVVAEPRWPSALEEAEVISRASGAETGSAASQTTEGPVEVTGVGPLVSGGPGTQVEAPVPARETTRPAVSDEGVAPVESAAISAAPQGPVESAGAASSDVTSPGAANIQAGASPGDYLDSARREYDAGRVATALAILDQFRERYPSGSDEAWWLYGQLYEASGPSRDIRTALDYYRRLVQEYPQSRRYDEARRRIAYLERYYINI